MEKFTRLVEELTSEKEVSLIKGAKPNELDKKIYNFIKDVAENGAGKKSSKEYTDIWGLEGMELFIRWSQWTEDVVKLKCKKTIEQMENKYPELKES